MSAKGKRDRKPESIVRKGYLKTHQTQLPERMHQEDLAALEQLTEDHVLDELQERLRQGSFHTFVGDVLLILNPNEEQDIYGPIVRYFFNVCINNNNCCIKKWLNFHEKIIWLEKIHKRAPKAFYCRSSSRVYSNIQV